MKIYKVKDEYIDKLKKTDNKIPHNKNKKRPYAGVVLKVNGLAYFAPLSSPKPKHLKMKTAKDFIKIDNGKLGAINLNNMIPIQNIKENAQLIDLVPNSLDNKENTQYKLLLNKQNNWINNNVDSIEMKAEKLYHSYVDNTLNLRVKERCVDFKAIEKFLENEKNIFATKQPKIKLSSIAALQQKQNKQ